jgi:DNA-binding NarL/FixJ family response regulator
MPRQRTQVILPLTDIKENEVFAPNFNDGEQVALVRYPHAGRFEIPILTVNNKNKQGKSDITMNAKDAIGIHPSVAERLSGADFDGDTVVVIPQSSKTRVMNAKPLKDLEDFDPHVEYAYREGMRVMQKSDIQKEMGMISNLITDMTLRGAPESEIARAVKHSMVVIDANKHKLDYKRSEVDNGISELKDRWQRRTTEDGEEKTGGASTIISRRKQSVYIPERQGSGRIDKETGEIIYKESGRTYLGKKGQAYVQKLIDEATRKDPSLLEPGREADLKKIRRDAYNKAMDDGYAEQAQEKIPIMSAVKDARALSSGHPIEEEYADYANKLKAMANQARKEYANTKDNPKDSAAAAEYDEEVKSIKAKIAVAATNAPRERRAQILANAYVHQITQEHPELLDKNHKKELRRIKQRAIADARDQVGAKGKDTRVDISDREWEAISKNAVAGSTLNELMRYADADKLRERAMPKATTVVSPAKVAQIKALSANGFSNADIAERTGLSISTIHDYVSC